MPVKSNLYGTQLSEKESIEKMVKRGNSDKDPISFSTVTCNYLSSTPSYKRSWLYEHLVILLKPKTIVIFLPT